MQEDGKIYAATLVRSQRIAPPESPEEVRHLVFRRDDPGFDCRMRQCVRVMALGQYGNKYHPRLYRLLLDAHELWDLDEAAPGLTEDKPGVSPG